MLAVFAPLRDVLHRRGSLSALPFQAARNGCSAGDTLTVGKSVAATAHVARPMMSNQRERRGGVRRRESHATMRGRSTKAANFVRAVNSVSTRKKHGGWAW